jgi:hypothetical protein
LNTRDVAIVRRYQTADIYGYEIIDDQLQRHIVEVQASVLDVEPSEFSRGTDQQHLDIVACGAVLTNLTPDATYHRVDREMVDRAYRAAVRLQSFERLTV